MFRTGFRLLSPIDISCWACSKSEFTKYQNLSHKLALISSKILAFCEANFKFPQRYWLFCVMNFKLSHYVL